MTKNSLFYIKIVIIVSTPLLLLANNSPLLVQDRYPGAQAWFNQMSEKYPQAHLKNVKFYVSDEESSGQNQYYSGPNAIYFPKESLEQLNRMFSSVQSGKTGQSIWNSFPEAEYLLLHEAAHVLNKDNEKGAIVLPAAFLTFLAINSSLSMATLSENIKTLPSIALLTAGNVALITGLYSYVRFQEYKADQFANKQASTLALLAGFLRHLKIHTDRHGFNLENINSWSTKLRDAFLDPSHPSPIDSANQTLQEN